MAYTIVEVKNNIKYNEDLVKSYQSSIKKLNEQILELIALKAKLQSYQKDFSNRESNRKKRVTNGFGDFNFKFLVSYIKGMNNLISGSEYRKAYNGLSESGKIVEKQINKLRMEISDYNEKIKYRKERITYWKNQLKIIQSQGINDWN